MQTGNGRREGTGGEGESATGGSNDRVSRSLSLDLFAPDGLRQDVLNGIRRYRCACRQLYAVLASAYAAGATLTEDDEHGPRLRPSNERARQILASITGHDGKAQGYPLRPYFLQHLYPGALSFVWDSARRDIASVWRAADPEFPQAQRGWLALQGARGLAQFQRRGIGCPVATARPRLAGYSLTLKWDHGIGAVEFALGKLDAGRRHVWLNLRDGEAGHELGTVYLSERDGRIFACLSYSRPAAQADVDLERILSVQVHKEGPQLLTLSSEQQADGILAADVEAWLRQHAARRQALEERRAAHGSPNRPWGHRKGWLAAQDVLSRHTVQRERGQADRNHAWTRRIVTRAVSWRCGTIAVAGASGPLRGHPWNWTQFVADLTYKAQERGVRLVRQEEASS